MTCVDDWPVYLADPDAFDEDHFALSLIDDDPAVAIPAEVMFAFSPNASTIVNRIGELRERTRFDGFYHLPARQEMKSDEKILETCQDCILKLAKFSEVRGNLDDASALRELEFRTTKDIEEFHTINIDRYRKRISSFMNLERLSNRSLTKKNEAYYAAKEAVLSMTNMPMVKNFILGSDIEIDIDFRPFFDLYLCGGQFTDFADEVVVFLPS